MIPAAAAAADAATIRRRSGVAGAVDFPRASPNRNCLGYRIRGVGTGMGLMRWERQSVPWQRRAVVSAVLFARCEWYSSGAQPAAALACSCSSRHFLRVVAS